jgi:biopolymer transport protein ExbD
MSRRYVSDSEESIDLTPMLDVVFILLIFFVVTASFINEFGLQLSRPDGTGSGSNELQFIQINVSAEGTVQLNNRVVATAALRSLLQQTSIDQEKTQVTVSVSPKALSQHYVPVFDAVNLAGLNRSVFMLSAQ